MDVAAAKSERCFGIVSDENGGGIDKGDGDSRGAESPTVILPVQFPHPIHPRLSVANGIELPIRRR